MRLLSTTCLKICGLVCGIPLTTGAIGAIAADPPQQNIPSALAAGGKICLMNDLQAARDSMLLFRKFRSEMRKIDILEEVDTEDEAELIGVLTTSLESIEGRNITPMGIPYPQGYGTGRTMYLVVYNAFTRELLWVDAEMWESRGNITIVESHKKLARRLKGALEGNS